MFRKGKTSNFFLKKIWLLLAVFLSFQLNYAQSIPSYTEREFFLQKDSLVSVQRMNSLTLAASEGWLNDEEYFVGPGDRLTISIAGVNNYFHTLTIDQEGYLLVPQAGQIDLRDLTLSQAKESIQNALLNYFKDIEIQISLIDVRKIKVRLSGFVDKPISFVLPANTRLIDFMVNAVELKPTADLRNIKIVSVDNSEKFYDLLSVLRLADSKNNPYLREGDIIIISKNDMYVQVFGSVLYPGTYEFVENETIDELIKLAGGPTFKAKIDSIEVIRYEKDYRKLFSLYYSLDEINSSKPEVNVYDKIVVRVKPKYLMEEVVEVKGFVRYPGIYKIVEDSTTLSQIILNEAGGFLDNASLRNSAVTRNVGVDEIDPEYERLKTIPRADMTDDEYDYFKAKSREKRGRMVVNFEKLFDENDFSEDIILKRGDEIYVPEIKNYITLVGQVVNPGNITYLPQLNVDDYIELAGGFAWRAIEGDVRVIKASTGEWIEAEDVEELSPGDIIWVPEDPPPPKFWDVFTDALGAFSQVAAVVTAVVALIVAAR